MAIANAQEMMLMYTKQKAMLTERLSNVQFNMLSATRQSGESQTKYNAKQQYYYYKYGRDEDYADVYDELIAELDEEHDFDMQNLNSWEQQLEMDKSNYETRLNEITQFESTWKSMLQNNIKKDFQYGGASQ